MAIQNRTVSITGIFAQDANTNIPQTPVAGQSYRDTSLTESEVKEGWPFKEIVDSAKFNQYLFEVASINKLFETYGFLPWSNLTDYDAGSVCLGTDGKLYQAKQATGPSTTPYNPVNDRSHTYWNNTFARLPDNNSWTGSNSFSVSPTIPTPAASDNSTKGATTAFVQTLIASMQEQITSLQTTITNLPKNIFPVGSLYSTVTNTNPATILGFGTWSQVASSIITGSSNANIWGDGTHALGLEYYDKTNSVSKYGTMQQSAKHDYSNGTNVGTSLGIATKTTNNKLSDNYNNIGGQGYNGYSSGYGANVVSKGHGTSGLYADLSALKTTIYIWKRTA